MGKLLKNVYNYGIGVRQTLSEPPKFIFLKYLVHDNVNGELRKYK